MNHKEQQEFKPAAFAKPNQDEQQLALLAIFHYALGAVTGLFSLFPSIHLIIGVLMINGAFDSPDPPPAFLGWLMVVSSSLFILGGLVFSVVVALNGRRLAKRKGHRACLAVAGIECVFMPLGTILGVFTIIVLMRPSVKQLFGVQPAGKLTK